MKTHASRHEKEYVGVARSKDRDGGVFETAHCQTKDGDVLKRNDDAGAGGSE